MLTPILMQSTRPYILTHTRVCARFFDAICICTHTHIRHTHMRRPTHTHSARYAESAEAAKSRIDTAVRHSVTCKPSGISRSVRSGSGCRQFELTFESERRFVDDADDRRCRRGRSEHVSSGSEQRSSVNIDRCRRWRRR